MNTRHADLIRAAPAAAALLAGRNILLSGDERLSFAPRAASTSALHFAACAVSYALTGYESPLPFQLYIEPLLRNFTTI